MPVLVLAGLDNYLLEQRLHQLRADVVDPAFASLTHKIIRKPTLANVLEAVGSVSLCLGGQTLIELWDFPQLQEGAKDKGDEKQLEELKSLLTDLDANKHVVFISAKPDSRLKFTKWLFNQPDVTVEKFDPLNFWETGKGVDFVVGYAKRQNSQIQPQAADLLVSVVGLERRQLASEVDKLLLFTQGKAIDTAAIEHLGYQNDNVFTLVQHWITQTHPAETINTLQDILRKRHAMEVFSVIQTNFNNAFRSCWLNQNGMSPDRIAQQTGQKPFTVQKSINLYRSVTSQRWQSLKTRLVELEWQSKTGQLDAETALTLLLAC